MAKKPKKPAVSASAASGAAGKSAINSGKPKLKVSYRFDAKNKRAARVVKAAGAKLVKSVTTETRDAIRTIIAKAIREGVHPYDAAKSIVGVIGAEGAAVNALPGMAGLNTPQMLAATNYKAGLIDMGHSPSMVDLLMAKYVGRKLRERAEMIARTETMWALNTGAQAGYIQAMKGGWIPPDSVLEWITTPDERLCSKCAPMNGQTKPVGAETTFPNGSYGPPLHPRCRCSVAMKGGA